MLNLALFLVINRFLYMTPLKPLYNNTISIYYYVFIFSCDSKPMKNPVTESRNSNHFHGAFSYLQKRNSKEIPSKLDSVNLLYDRDQNETNNVKANGPPKEEKRSESFLDVD